eukprot:CAMPEP_0206171682 /NCGR_PEP_ID=MMETSP1474-20131121/43221_1 /ASSEMBLY_ACC=CAM_ASM_001110 /TAXON_ID=97495 /ORGANISM="Imantonia sp., Strain RCC918" /LENGTH=86 /DNA_ID=CAMNT_0053579331 /DNA_START=441 /DNA_END=700 /DNA_ORIENTATION=-
MSTCHNTPAAYTENLTWCPSSQALFNEPKLRVELIWEHPAPAFASAALSGALAPPLRAALNFSRASGVSADMAAFRSSADAPVAAA